jgi:TrmH family RNA methyltransferase
MITSAANDKIKHARRVRDGREEGLIFVEGLRLAEECLKSGLVVQACFHTPDPSGRLEAVLQQVPAGSRFVVQPSVLHSISDTVSSQGIVLIAERPGRLLKAELASDSLLILGLDRVQDPGNVGTLFRTAEAAGVSGIVLTEGCADPFSPKSVRSAMGSAFRMAMASAESFDANGLTIVAAAGSGTMNYYDYDWRQPTLLWLGNEARGLDEALLRSADVQLRIPMHAGVESLNVAAAGAALLFEAARQRRMA